MRKMTIAILLALLAVSALVSACPRDKGDQTNVRIEDEAPAADGTVVADDDGADNGETNIDVNVDTSSEGGEAAGDGDGAQTEGDTAAGDGDAAAGDGAKEAGETGTETPAEPAKEKGDVTVVLETSKGDIVLAVHKDWAPIGAEHFLELVRANFYAGAPWFRVIPGFVAQCGIAADPKVTAQWQNRTIQDEPVKQGNTRGMVAFGKSGAPNSRSTHVFINLVDNTSSLDPQGFACFAEVTAGMDVVDKLFPAQFEDQAALSSGGIELFKQRFPQGDTITRAYVKE